MTTFLKLCQNVARKSGIVSGVAPATVINQKDLLFSIVEYVNEAWNLIQIDQDDWLWMRKEFGSAATVTTSNTPRYTGGGSWAISDFSEFRINDNSYTIYDEEIGVADETGLAFLNYETWRKTYERGVRVPNRPSVYSVSPSGELCLGPVPDKAYRVRGEYHQEPQALAANEDVPGMPAKFHSIIEYEALLLLAEQEEAIVAMATAEKNHNQVRIDLMRSQLPSVLISAEPLA